MSELRYDGKVAVITGAGHGLGRCHALLLASRGAKVVVNDLGGSVEGTGASDAPARKVADEIKSKGGEAVPNFDTVSTLDGAQKIIQTALDAFGRVDIVINNAGILRDKSLKNMTEELFSSVIEVHLYGTAYVTMAAWPHLYDQQYGRIINTTSAAGLFGNFGQTNYAAAKMGIVGFTKVLAIEGAKKNVKANALAPGARTRMTEELLGPMAEHLTPERVSPVAAFLAHESCPCTGEVLSAGGGRVARVFVGAVPGWFEPDLTIEGIQANWEKIMSTDGFFIPSGAQEEMAPIFQMWQERQAAK